MSIRPGEERNALDGVGSGLRAVSHGYCGSRDVGGLSAPAAMSDGWPVSPSAQQGLDPQLICSTGLGLAKLTEADPHGVVVIRHGVLVYEQYFADDDIRGWTPLGVVPHDANTLHNIQSITKSVVVLLVGIAFDRGWLKDIDARYPRSFPNTTISAPRRKIGLRCVTCCR